MSNPNEQENATPEMKSEDDEVMSDQAEVPSSPVDDIESPVERPPGEGGDDSNSSGDDEYYGWRRRKIPEWVEPKTLEDKRKLYTRKKYVTIDKVDDFIQYSKVNKVGKAKEENYWEKIEKNDEICKKISLYQGDITLLEIDAIVNAANTRLSDGGGVCGAIHDNAGPWMEKENDKNHPEGIDRGGASITKGYKLPAKFVLHAVGPIDEKSEDQLESAYLSCLKLMVENNLKTVAFCCISTGIYGFPLINATKVALRTVRKWMDVKENRDKIDRIVFCVYLDKEKEVYEYFMPRYFPMEKDENEIQSDEEPKIEKRRFRRVGGGGNNCIIS